MSSRRMSRAFGDPRRKEPATTAKRVRIYAVAPLALSKQHLSRPGVPRDEISLLPGVPPGSHDVELREEGPEPLRPDEPLEPLAEEAADRLTRGNNPSSGGDFVRTESSRGRVRANRRAETHAED